MDQREAHAFLMELLETKGALRIITATHECLQGQTMPNGNLQALPSTDKEMAACDGYAETLGSAERFPSNPLADPKHFIIHDVVRVEPSIMRGDGYLTAYSDEGDRIEGTPIALLRRLTEATRAGAGTRPKKAPADLAVLFVPEH